MRFLYTFFTSGYQKSGYHRLGSAQKLQFLIFSSLQVSRDLKNLGCDQPSFLIFGTEASMSKNCVPENSRIRVSH